MTRTALITTTDTSPFSGQGAENIGRLFSYAAFGHTKGIAQFEWDGASVPPEIPSFIKWLGSRNTVLVDISLGQYVVLHFDWAGGATAMPIESAAAVLREHATMLSQVRRK